MTVARIGLGLVGAGRMGAIHARAITRRIPEARLVGVADLDIELARRVADELGVDGAFGSAQEMLERPDVDAVIVAVSSSHHLSVIRQAASAGRDIFCEKPLALTIADSEAAMDATSAAGVRLQIGFMRRFDPAYRRGMRRLAGGEVGRPILFKSLQFDPGPPPLAFADPAISGGIHVDMGIHEYDLARWLMDDEVVEVHAWGSSVAYPELATVGDIDNAIASLTFTSGKLGVVDLTRSGIYGYDISTEILGLEGTIRIGYLRETPIMVMTKANGVSHDTVPYFMERFRDAYTNQLQNFAQNVLHDRPAPITIDDGMEALRLGVAATRAREQGGSVTVTDVTA
jgi:inositol 2-dehydrogenase